MRVRLSEAARADIRAIYREGVERFGPKQGDVYADGLRASIQRLGQFPRSAPVRAGLRASIRILPYRSHIVLYELDPAGVHVLRVRHGLEDWLDSLP